MAVNDVALVYADSLFDIAKDNNSLDDTEWELKVLAEVIAEDRDFRDYLNTPGISKESKKELVGKIFAGKLSEITMNFLQLLIDKGRQSFLGAIYESFVELNDIAKNRQRVTVVTQSGLDDSLREKIKSEIGKKNGKEIILKEEVDETILGGIKIKIGDFVIDGSLSKGLENIRRNLLKSKVRSEVAYED